MATVLVVDSDRGFVARLRRGLQAAGHRVATASSASEALHLMREQTPDAVVTEVMIDYVLAGWDLVRAMRADPALCGVPVVITTSLTGAPTHAGEGQADSVDVSAWLAKPVSPAEVLQHLVPLLASPEAT